VAPEQVEQATARDVPLLGGRPGEQHRSSLVAGQRQTMTPQRALADPGGTAQQHPRWTLRPDREHVAEGGLLGCTPDERRSPALGVAADQRLSGVGAHTAKRRTPALLIPARSSIFRVAGDHVPIVQIDVEARDFHGSWSYQYTVKNHGTEGL
jgi:hypothetical protein